MVALLYIHLRAPLHYSEAKLLLGTSAHRSQIGQELVRACGDVLFYVERRQVQFTWIFFFLMEEGNSTLLGTEYCGFE